MPRSHNLYRHGLTNATRNWANPIPERLRSPAYGDAGTIPLQVIEVQPLPANTVNGSGRDMRYSQRDWHLRTRQRIRLSRIGPEWSPRADVPAGPPLASSRSDYAFRLDSQSVVGGTAQLYGPVNLAANARTSRSTSASFDRNM